MKYFQKKYLVKLIGKPLMECLQKFIEELKIKIHEKSFDKILDEFSKNISREIRGRISECIFVRISEEIPR